MVEGSSITRAQAKEAIREALRTGRPVQQVVQLKKLSAVVDEGAIAAVIEKVVAARPGALDEARGDKKAFNYLVGQVLREEPKAQPGGGGQAPREEAARKEYTADLSARSLYLAVKQAPLLLLRRARSSGDRPSSAPNARRTSSRWAGSRPHFVPRRLWLQGRVGHDEPPSPLSRVPCKVRALSPT